MTKKTAYKCENIFTGKVMFFDHFLLVQNGKVVGIEASAPANVKTVDLKNGIIAPGFVDIQVNGGGGVMLNENPSVETFQTIANAHAALGTTTLLPTLISDSSEKTSAVIDLCKQAIIENVAGIGGLHLEGPHLSEAHKGAHDMQYIRPMNDQDLGMLVNAARTLPTLVLTIAPESVTERQVQTLTEAGAIVSLGHTDADYKTCQQYCHAGATLATHLFNAMSQFQSREPGLVGAAINNGAFSAGLIADGIHVHPDTIRLAMHAKQGKGEIFLVTDSMALAGTTMKNFMLDGREIELKNRRLTLKNGTLAGAYLDFSTALRVMVQQVNIPLEHALRMATSIPAQCAGLPSHGRLEIGSPANFVHLDDNLNLTTTWRAGIKIHPK